MILNNDFKVFDEDKKVWIDEKDCILYNGILFRNSQSFMDMKEEDLNMYYSSGIKDCSNKKIYVNSSIVKFKYLVDFQLVSLIGVLMYDTKQHKMTIEIMDKNTPYCMVTFDLNKLNKPQIIDTLQDDSLGLVEELNFEEKRFNYVS